MKFSATVFSLLAFEVAATSIKQQRTLRMKGGSGGSKGGSKGGSRGGGGSGFQPNTKFQAFTPAYMFTIGMDTSSEWTYVADEGAYIYQVETMFGDGEEDESYCNNIGCFREYYTFATKGKKKNANQWSVTVASSGISSMHWVCPLPQMTPSATGFCQNDSSTPGFPTTTPTTYTLTVNGPTVDGMQANPDCGEYLVELICTGTAEEIALIGSFEPSDSPGFDSRPYTDAALMMAAENGKTFWSANHEVTSFDVVDFDKDGDANACNTFACSDSYDTVLYLRGPDPLYAEIQGEIITSSFRFLCPDVDHTIVLTPTCNGAITTWGSDPVYHGPYAYPGSVSCTDTFPGLSIRCIDPTPEVSGNIGNKGKGSRRD